MILFINSLQNDGFSSAGQEKTQNQCISSYCVGINSQSFAGAGVDIHIAGASGV